MHATSSSLERCHPEEPRSAVSKGARVQYHPVVEQFITYPPLDPAALLLFTALFAGVVLATIRRAALGLAVLAFITPFAFYHTVGITTVTWGKVTVLAVIVGLLPSWRVAFERLRGVRVMLWAFTAIIIAIALSALGARDRGVVLSEALKWIEYGLFFCVAYVAYMLDPQPVWIRRSLYLSIAFVCASALVQEFTGAPWAIMFGPGIAPRISGVIEGPNQLAAYLEVALATVIAWRTRDGSWESSLLAFAIGLTLLLTFSRGGVIGSVIVVLVVVWFERKRWAQAARPIVAGAALGAIADLAWAQAARTLPVLRNPSSTFAGAGGVGNRPELWRAAWFFFKRSPIFGIGAGNYEIRLSEAGLYGVRTHANSWYLQALAEGGIVLFAATIFFNVAALIELRPWIARSAWTLAAFAATLALAIHQIADYLVFYPKVAEPWITLLALGMAARTSTPACD